MNIPTRAFLLAGVVFVSCFVMPAESSEAELPNPFFAMNFALRNPELNALPDVQARHAHLQAWPFLQVQIAPPLRFAVCHHRSVLCNCSQR